MSHERARINGEQLRLDRKLLGLSQENVIDAIKAERGMSLSIMTLRRAEGGLASLENLHLIASALKTSTSRYLPIPHDDTPADFDLSGEWTVIYAESEVVGPTYYAVESLTIEQLGSSISGMYTPIASTHPDGYVGSDSFAMKGKIRGPMIIGSYERTNKLDLRGTGFFHLKMIRENDWAEGVCTFYTWDSTIGVSINIWIRNSAKHYNILIRQAKSIFSDGHRTLFELPISIPIS